LNYEQFKSRGLVFFDQENPLDTETAGLFQLWGFPIFTSMHNPFLESGSGKQTGHIGKNGLMDSGLLSMGIFPLGWQIDLANKKIQ
jgi:hypothetical protein